MVKFVKLISSSSRESPSHPQLSEPAVLLSSPARPSRSSKMFMLMVQVADNKYGIGLFRSALRQRHWMRATIENRLGVVSCLVASVLISAGVLPFRNTQQIILVNRSVTRTNEVLAAISETLSALQSAQNHTTDFAIIGRSEEH